MSVDDIRFPLGGGPLGGGGGEMMPELRSNLPRSNAGSSPFSSQEGVIAGGPLGSGNASAPKLQYTMPGILHFLQSEWSRFESAKAQWDLERSELQARIAFLDGERRGQENLKKDLIRRIKMLEYALKQERIQYHKLKYGTDLNFGDLKTDFDKENTVDEDFDFGYGSGREGQNVNTNIRQGRQLLRQYLKEVGYSDAVLEVRAARVRQILGLPPDKPDRERSAAGDLPASGAGGTAPGGLPGKGPGLVNGDAFAHPHRAPAGSALLGEKGNALRDQLAGNSVPPRRLPVLHQQYPQNQNAASDRNPPPNSASARNAPQDASQRAASANPPGSNPNQNRAKETESKLMNEILGRAAAATAASNANADAERADGDFDSKDRLGDGFEDRYMDDLSEERSRPSPNDAASAFGPSEEPSNDADAEQALAEFDFLVQQDSTDNSINSGDVALADVDAPSSLPLEPSGRQSSDGSSGADIWPTDPTIINSMKEQYRRERVNAKRGALGPLPHINLTSDGMGSGAFNPANPDEEPGLDESALADRVDNDGEQDVEGRALSEPTPMEGGATAVASLSPDSLPQQLSVGGLGELADLGLGAMVSGAGNDLDSIGIPLENSSDRRTWSAKFTLRSHFDGIRAVTFHPKEPVLITASEDHTIKLWHLTRSVPAKKNTTHEIEPFFTIRGHMKPVLAIALNQEGTKLYSADLTGIIRSWNVPSSSIDPYDPFDATSIGESLSGHLNAVWSLAMHPTQPQLLSVGADQTVRLWSIAPRAPDEQPQSPLLQTFVPLTDEERDQQLHISCACFVQPETGAQLLVALTDGTLLLMDTETGRIVSRFEGPNSGSQIYRAVCQYSMGLCVSAHEDKQIRFWELSSGRQVHSMVAHQDAVTSLALDPSGLYMLSGSHDCSVRLWSLSTRTCTQEITAHRRKNNESIHDVTFHPSLPFCASAGADAIAKVFQA